MLWAGVVCRHGVVRRASSVWREIGEIKKEIRSRQGA
jgi:hypothetical protein